MQAETQQIAQQDRRPKLRTYPVRETRQNRRPSTRESYRFGRESYAIDRESYPTDVESYALAVGLVLVGRRDRLRRSPSRVDNVRLDVDTVRLGVETVRQR